MNQTPLFVGGYYIPYYFEIKLKTKENPKSLATLPKEIQRSYYHEWWHYLQNITTTFGVMGTWHVYDWLRQMVAFIQQAPDGLQLPLDRSQQTNLRQVQTFLNMQSGGKELNNVSFPPDEYEIADVITIRDELVEDLLPGANLGCIRLSLLHKTRATATYDFGRTAIAECMALMAEERHYGKEPLMPRYPYRIAQDLAAREYPPVADGEERQLALCDVALMHPLPGWAFYHLLQEMKNDGFSTATGEGVIDYGMAKYKQWGWDIEKQRHNAVTGLQKVVDELFQHPGYAETVHWLKTVMVMGHNLREEEPYFTLKLFRDDPFGPIMTQIWLRVGGPHCINEENERCIRLPEHLHQESAFVDAVFPQRLRVVKQFIQLLVAGMVECGLYDICANSQPPTVDGRCQTAPWERVHEKEKCPYAAAWINWGFHDRTWYINGRTVKT